MADLFEVLASDHRETLERLDSLRHAPHDRPEDHIRLNELTQELVIAASKHEAVEEMYFWPAVRDLGDKGVHLADAGLGEEVEGKRILDELDSRTPSAPDFDEVLGRFSDAVRAHIRFEEEQVWPVLAPALDQGARQALAAKVERARRLAPTHPYPSAPLNPTALKAVGPATGLADRARDALTGRGQRPQDEAPAAG
ncbi:MAG: hemerythrin domain-containing protein, partial [Acidimicrobiaceae bacterium]|nr:hemerythrin domain-containing protein [Acidimicrobiaceae bacterium]